MIPIKNIYYMLTYAFRILSQKGFKKLSTEHFDTIDDLYAEILILGISNQLKKGLFKDYVNETKSSSTLRGKIEIDGYIKNRNFLNKDITCSYDEFTHNNYLNQILKTTLTLLLSQRISNSRKKRIKKLLLYFREINLLDYRIINWDYNFRRNNKTYQLLISICFLVINNLLQKEDPGEKELMKFSDDQYLSRLFEKFVLEYYRIEFPNINVRASQVPWGLNEKTTSSLLPKMQTDITLTYKDKILIIDTKFYSHMTQKHFNTRSLHSSNLYQIFTYVKNKEYQMKNKIISGMLLYAQSDEDYSLNESFMIMGNHYSIRSIDLNCDFNDIRKQLDTIIEENLL